MTATADGRRLVTLAPPADSGAGLKLICCPHAGGGALAFTQAARWAPDWLELTAWQPPGRGTRSDEAPAPSISAAAAEIVAAIENPEAVAVLGHSMGALLALETARQLQARQAAPAALFVVAARPPGDPHGPGQESLSDDGYISYLASLGGTPAEVLSEPGLVSRALPSLRSDLSLLRAYELAGSWQLRCPIAALASTDDETAPAHRIVRWRQFTSGPFSLHLIRGGHFAIHERADAWQLVFGLLRTQWRMNHHDA